MSRWIAALALVSGIFLIVVTTNVALAYVGVHVAAPAEPKWQQQTDVTCGPSSLRFLLYQKYGTDISESDLSILSDTSVRGTSLYGLKQAVSALGHDAVTWRWDKAHLANLPTPSLIHLHRWSHFAVVTDVNEDLITVFDPLRGHLQFTPLAFRYFWDGIVLEVR